MTHSWTRLFYRFSLLFLLSLVPINGATRLIFPRLTFESGTITGIAIVNPNGQDADVVITAYGADGKTLSTTGFTNPVIATIGAGQQYAHVTSALFPGWSGGETMAWFEVVSTADNLNGFFLYLDPELTYFDGADLPKTSKTIVFKDVRSGQDFNTELNIINAGPQNAQVELELVGADRTVKKSLSLNLKGVFRFDAENFFQDAGQPPPERGYVLASSTVDLAGFELVAGPDDVLGLNANPSEENLQTILFPQLAVLGPFESEVLIVNPGEDAVIVTLSAYQPDGTLYAGPDVQTNPVTRAMDPGESLALDVAELFGFRGQDVRQGWLKVESTSESLYGSLSYALPLAGSLAAVEGSRLGRRQAVFSHIATTLGFFTGVAVLNGGTLAANIQIVALRPDGSILGSFATTLRPGERLSKLITDLIPESMHQGGGLIWVNSDVPVHLTSLFGNNAGTVLANIPAQNVPKSYQPASGEARLEIRPPLAVMSPVQQQTFTLKQGEGSAEWKVNGIPGGNQDVGTVTSSGQYKAPATVPSVLPVTVMASLSDQTAGATVDVLRKEVLLGGLGVVQSVAFLNGLDRLYTAELAVIGAAGTAGGKYPLNTLGTKINDVTSGIRSLVIEFPGEEISKMVSFDGIDSREYLLLASETGGRIMRLDPQTSDLREVASGLKDPQAIVMDPITGDLLVAEAGQVSTVPISQLNLGLSQSSLAVERNVAPRSILTDGQVTGLTVDRCTGNIISSLGVEGLLQVYDRKTSTWTTLVEGLIDPGHLLTLYRYGVDCPVGTDILVAERGKGRVTAVDSENGDTIPWADAPGVRDLVFIPGYSAIAGKDGVLVAAAPEEVGNLTLVETPGLYQTAPVHPPATKSLQTLALDSCAVLDQENATYVLTRDLGAAEITDNCMNIVADHVTLDCQGHSLIDQSVVFAGIIYSERDHTTVRNCTVSAATGPQGDNDGSGIYLKGIGGLVEFNRAVDGFWGIRAEGSFHVIQHNVVEGNAKGIHIEGFNHVVKNNLLRNNSNWQSFGLALWNGQGNQFLNNKVYGSAYGLIVYGATDTTVMECGVLEGNTFLYQNTEPFEYLPCANTDCTWTGDVCQ